MILQKASPAIKITRARVALIADAPFFGILALKLIVIEDPTCKTAWTDGVHMGYNPVFVDRLSFEHTKFLMIHEVLHCVFGHHLRRGERNPKKWNRAGDYIVNYAAVKAKYHLIPDCLYNDTFGPMHTEQVYNLLPDTPDGGDGEGKGGIGEVRDLPAGNDPTQKASPADMKAAENDWKVSTIAAAERARKQGKLPGYFESWIDSMLNPKVDYTDVLRQFISKVAKSDLSWTYPNRRLIYRNLYLPGLRSEEIGELIVVTDSSQSVSDENQSQFLGELSGMLEAYKCSVTHLQVDTRVTDVQEYTSDDLPLVGFKVRGRGGTSFRPPFDWVEEELREPSCLIYLTDMEADFPDDLDPSYPVLWITCRPFSKTVPFGEVIEM